MHRIQFFVRYLTAVRAAVPGWQRMASKQQAVTWGRRRRAARFCKTSGGHLQAKTGIRIGELIAVTGGGILIAGRRQN